MPEPYERIGKSSLFGLQEGPKGVKDAFYIFKKSKKTVWLAVSSYFKDSALQHFGRYKKSATFSVSNRVLIKGEGLDLIVEPLLIKGI